MRSIKSLSFLYPFQVLHPGVRQQVEIDLLLMKAGSWLLHCVPSLKWLSLYEIVEEFEKLMTKQVRMFTDMYTVNDKE